MLIKDIFTKSIDRKIKGVIKVGQLEDSEKKQELEEYVVTRELQKHFATFFEAYQKSITGKTDEMGVWISGFFGSGKSHFLKILSYLLKNDVVAGKNAIDYFQDKITDPYVLGLMDNAAKVPTDVILFNIDSKADANSRNDKSAILNVFLSVFNEMQGYSTVSPYIADLERDLKKAGKYQAFKERFYELNPQRLKWEEGVYHYKLQKGTITRALVEIGYTTEENAKGYMDSLNTPYEITIETFAKRVNEYIEEKGNNYHVVFLVDEVGQFIGDDVNWMLNLQTIVEELGARTQGKAWVVVTSQQAINEVTKNTNGQDFSKIQGRFNTRISMSSANVDEVIKKRLLEKKTGSYQQLEDLFNNNEHNINNMIDFDDGLERKKFKSAKDFADTYPFIPYQFNLLQDVLNEIRLHGSDGKHLSEGERSMLATFQESAESYKNEQVGKLIPFSEFFEGLMRFLDHNHQIVIERATDSHLVNPHHEDNPFALKVLKALFMVKYVNNFKATINNLTTLMIDSIDVDRTQLQNEISRALKILESQNYILKNVDTYEFLTDTEQDINTEIKKQNYDDSLVAKEIGYLFTSNTISNKYTYPKMKGRYLFKFNEFVDNKPVKPAFNEMSIGLYTPLFDEPMSDADLAQISMSPENPTIIVRLPDKGRYIEFYRRAGKISRFLNQARMRAQQYQQDLVNAKANERKSLIEEAQNSLMSALDVADVFVQGKKLDSKRDFSRKLDEAQQALVEEIYGNLSYITAAKSFPDIISIFKNYNNEEEFVEDKDDNNPRAIQAVKEEISRQAGNNGKITLRSLIGIFSKIPYGYTDEDTQWLVVKLFADGELRADLNGEKLDISTAKENAHHYADYFTKKQYLDKLTLNLKKVPAPKLVKIAREFAKDILGMKHNLDGLTSTEKITSSILENLREKLDYWKENKNTKWPGDNYLDELIDYYNQLIQAGKQDHFFETLNQTYNDIYDVYDELDERGIFDFYQRENDWQKQWNSALSDIDKYKEAKQVLDDQNISDLVDEEVNLLKQNNPQRTHEQLLQLHNKFADVYNSLIDREFEKYQKISQKNKESLKNHLRDVNFDVSIEKNFNNKIDQKFKNLDEQIQAYSENGQVTNLLLGIHRNDDLRKDFNKRIDDMSHEIAKENENIATSPIPNKTETYTSETLEIRDLMKKSSLTIKKGDDIDEIVKSLENSIREELKKNDIITINF
jgi:hypothetical protein